MYRLARAALFRLPPERAHALGMGALSVLGRFPRIRESQRERALRLPGGVSPDLSVRSGGLAFAHPIALAAGLDKDAHAVEGLFALGFAAVEVGTVTPLPQPGNPLPRLFRLPNERALINRLGFNNAGMDAMEQALTKTSWRPGPLGINLGKNRDTPLARAAEDYRACVRRLAPLADYLVVNASSPNTPGLRDLLDPEPLAALLDAVQAEVRTVAPGKPLFLKIAPDLAPEAVDAVVDVALSAQLAGLIATNTTIARPVQDALASEPGGLSGRPLASLATETVRRAARRAAGRLAIWGVGGIFSADDAYEKIRAGAELVQVYTGFVYEGPGLVKQLLRGLAGLLSRDGFKRVSDAVGIDRA